ncbi:MAG: response regulator [Myxococcaceae bacterium]|nr:response regulator [Myxococcaceae bacterium]
MGDAPLVLVVDDYTDAREMFAEFLQGCGYRVEEAGDGAEALEKAFALRPDVILMDLSLPVLDGWEATRQLKRDPRTAGIPIVALTGHSIPGSQGEAARLGCDGIITKPCMPETLLAEVQRVLGDAVVGAR